MPLTVLTIGYPFAPVGPDAVGGAEQIVSALDRALVAAGHHSVVVAPEGSRVAGTLVAGGSVPVVIGEAERRHVNVRQRRAVAAALRRFPVDVVHCHSLDFADHLPDADLPTLVTLHLPRDFYPAGYVPGTRPRTWFNCVSASQRRSFPPFPAMLPEIDNGVAVDRLPLRLSCRGYALWLGRVCPEKGVAQAIDAAREAGVRLLLGGEVFPYEAHRRYFAEEVEPRLGPDARFLGPIGWARKRRLLNAARCLLVPSLAAESSSLVAMEAIACGTPVVAFPSGALADIVEPGITGYLVRDVRKMAAAIHIAAAIDRERCRERGRQRFSQERMIAQYFALYRRLAAA
ncbi:MAG TPA: glycosyltransferase [Stellaceae bacterium]|nr:glycosyltransferase [Stellaceae bacterium]